MLVSGLGAFFFVFALIVCLDFFFFFCRFGGGEHFSLAGGLVGIFSVQVSMISIEIITIASSLMPAFLFLAVILRVLGCSQRG